MKSDGSYTYFAGDVAYHYDKLQRGFEHSVNVFGADHIGYIPRMKAAVAALVATARPTSTILVCQLVKLSARTASPCDVEAGRHVRDAARCGRRGRPRPRALHDADRKNDAPLDFDFAKVMEQSKDNPSSTCSTRTRAPLPCSAMRRRCFPSSAPDSAAVREADLSKLTDAGEIDLIKRLAYLPALDRRRGAAEEPHRLAFYLYDLASALHGQWTRGNDLPHLRFIQAKDGVMTAARLALIAATQQVISSGLSVLGVEAPDSMR